MPQLTDAERDAIFAQAMSGDRLGAQRALLAATERDDDRDDAPPFRWLTDMFEWADWFFNRRARRV